MATETKPSDAPNRCDIVPNGSTTSEERPPLISMSRFVSSTAAVDEIARTASYARDPQKYLQSTLGPTTFETRKNFLCIPEKVDKDIYGNGEHKAHFQQHIANLLGKKHGLFFITGVQAQLAAMKIHCDRAGNNRVAWHVTSHLESAEEGAYKSLYGLQRVLVGNDKDTLPTVSEIKEVLSLSPSERPAALLIEIPNRVLGCQTYSFPDLQTISAACKEAGVKLHCDGARLWEIEPYYRQHSQGKISFAELGGLFDSVYVSFYKGLRGATGAILAHNSDSFIAEAKMWQRRAGGNAYTLFYEVIDCERGYNENIGTFQNKWTKMCEIVEGVTAATAEYKNGEGGQIVSFIPPKPTCCQIRTAFQGFTVEELLAARDRVQERLNVRVFEKMWPKKSLDEQGEEERAKRSGAGNRGEGDGEGVNGGKEEEEEKKEGAQRKQAEHANERRHVIEWMVVGQMMEVETRVFVDAYVGLCEELVAGQHKSSKR